MNERWILSIVTSGGKCSFLKKLAPIHLCCCSLGLLLSSFLGSKHTARITRNTCLPARAGKRSSGSRRRRLHTTRVFPLSTHLCVHTARVYDLPKDCPTFRLSCLPSIVPSHFIASSSFSSVLLFRPSADAFQYFGLGPAASRRPSAVGK